ncbi:MAG: hypothetical protein JO362_19060, partial [Streptomycetaceae bacterium]|nr:hypothetical protein [Streptomycetaceae bacterium]
MARTTVAPFVSGTATSRAGSPAWAPSRSPCGTPPAGAPAARTGCGTHNRELDASPKPSAPTTCRTGPKPPPPAKPC